MTALGDTHKKALLSHFKYVDSLLAQIEYLAKEENLQSPFAGYEIDTTTEKTKVIETHVAHIRSVMLRILASKDVSIDIQNVGVAKAVNTNLTFADITIEEIRPKYMRGYGELADGCDDELNEVVLEIQKAIKEFKNDFNRE